MTPEEKIGLEKDAGRSVTCQAGTDCEQKWSLVEQWIKTNSPYPIIANSDSLIATADPLRLDDSLSFTAVKTPGGNDTFDIVLDITCNDWFRCPHARLDARSRFADSIMGPPPPALAFGIKTNPVTPEMAQKLQMPNISGIIITEINSDSPAYKIGLREYDIIEKYNGAPVLAEDMLFDMIAKTPPGRHVDMVIIRNKLQQTLVVNS